MKLIAAAAIIAAAILSATAMTIYFSPYQTCLRNTKSMENFSKEVFCAQVAKT